MANGSRHMNSGADVLNFLRMFQGAAATFGAQNSQWSLWLPEFPEDGHPLTPASQIFFPVILRHDQQAFAIRFFYDCSSGKVRYYTSAIPEEISRLPKFENAISELFRHTLPVEPIRQRSLGRRDRKTSSDQPLKPRSGLSASLADPLEAAPVAVGERSPARPGPEPARALAVAPRLPVAHMQVPSPPPMAVVPVPDGRAPSPSAAVVRHWRFEIGPRVKSVLISFMVTVGIIVLGALAANAYLRATEDPGVLHHRLQLEEMRLRAGR